MNVYLNTYYLLLHITETGPMSDALELVEHRCKNLTRIAKQLDATDRLLQLSHKLGTNKTGFRPELRGLSSTCLIRQYHPHLKDKKTYQAKYFLKR